LEEANSDEILTESGSLLGKLYMPAVLALESEAMDHWEAKT